jgi:hypothetical protein
MASLWRVLTKGKKTARVHRETCRYIKARRTRRKEPWEWAEGRDPSEVWAASWNIPCRVCRPEAVPVQEKIGA